MVSPICGQCFVLTPFKSRKGRIYDYANYPITNT